MNRSQTTKTGETAAKIQQIYSQQVKDWEIQCWSLRHQWEQWEREGERNTKEQKITNSKKIGVAAATHPGSWVNASHTLLKGLKGWRLLQLAELSANAPEERGSLLPNGPNGPGGLLVPEEKRENVNMASLPSAVRSAKHETRLKWPVALLCCGESRKVVIGVCSQ